MISLSELGGEAMLKALSALMDGGGIEILSDRGYVLATLKLSQPAAQIQDGSILELNSIGEAPARASGTARSGRVITADGREIFTCDISDRRGDGDVKLNTTSIHEGSPIALSSFTLVLP